MSEQDINKEIDPLVDALTGALQPLLQAMDVMNQAGRYLHPPKIQEIAAELAKYVAPLETGLDLFRRADWPAHMQPVNERIETAARQTLDGLQGFQDAAASTDGTFQAYRALRRATRAQETIYPLASMLPPVSIFFLEEAARQDPDLQSSLLGVDGPGVGIIHASNDKGERGGFSLYVPEYYDETKAYPLVMALHGGTGHGRDFLWSWVRAARSLGAVVISPTSRGNTWDLMGGDSDSANLNAILNHVRENWNIDDDKLLLTGMSDGGTFTYVSGLLANSPFTHLSPVAASFHPMIVEMCDRERLQDLPIYLVHGVLDWMFNIDIARTANATLVAAGANITYREIQDLSHTYPRDENVAILNWLTDDNWLTDE